MLPGILPSFNKEPIMYLPTVSLLVSNSRLAVCYIDTTVVSMVLCYGIDVEIFHNFSVVCLSVTQAVVRCLFHSFVVHFSLRRMSF